MKTVLRFALLFSLVVMFSYSTAYAASYYYVDNSVASNGNGTQGSPWKNLSNINWSTISSASKPCTILVSGGASGQTYTEDISIGVNGSSSTWPYSGTPTGEIVIKQPTSSEWPGHIGTATIVGGIDLSNRSNIVIDGFSHVGQIGLWPGANYCTIRNMTATNWPGFYIITGSGTPTHHITIQNNSIQYPNPTTGDDPMELENLHDYVIEKNIIKSGTNVGSGQHFDNIAFTNGGSSLNVIIRHNIMRTTNSAGIAVYSDDMGPGLNVEAYVYGNIFEWDADMANNAPGFSVSGTVAWVKFYVYDNVFVNWSVPGGFGFQGGGTNASNVFDLRNNIFYKSWMTMDQSGGGTVTLDNNIYYSTSSGTVVQWGPVNQYTCAQFAAYKAVVAPNEANSLCTNPLLTSVSATLSPNHDLRPTSSSPGNGHGVALGSPYNVGLSMDNTKSSWPLSVTTSIRSGTPDIGAYVYVQAGDTTPPAAPSGLTVN